MTPGNAVPGARAAGFRLRIPGSRWTVSCLRPRWRWRPHLPTGSVKTPSPPAPTSNASTRPTRCGCRCRKCSCRSLPREVHKKGDHRAISMPAPCYRLRCAAKNIGLVSEAGMPAIADPGSSVVRAAHELGCQWCRWSGQCRYCWPWPPAGSTGRVLRLSATCPALRRAQPTHPRTGSAGAENRANPTVHRDTPTAMRAACKRWCKRCSTTPDWQPQRPDAPLADRRAEPLDQALGHIVARV
jgi:hypothetical protein